MDKNEQAFDRAWNRLGKAIIECVEKATALDEVWEIDRDEACAALARYASDLPAPDLWLMILIVATLREINQKIEVQIDQDARRRQNKLPSNVIDLRAALRDIYKEDKHDDT